MANNVAVQMINGGPSLCSLCIIKNAILNIVTCKTVLSCTFGSEKCFRFLEESLELLPNTMKREMFRG
jgi:hypothetical protein